jgi:hypothetical protein
MTSRSRTISEYVNETARTLARYEAVQKEFPKAKVNMYLEFSDRAVNQLYTNFTFEKNYNGLFVVPYCEVHFEHKGHEETVKVHSTPRRNKLVHLTYDIDPTSKKRIMKFARMTLNLKNNHFKEDMLNSCKAEMMNFIKDNPGFHLDTKHLEPRLKKLLLFT